MCIAVVVIVTVAIAIVVFVVAIVVVGGGTHMVHMTGGRKRGCYSIRSRGAKRQGMSLQCQWFMQHIIQVKTQYKMLDEKEVKARDC